VSTELVVPPPPLRAGTGQLARRLAAVSSWYRVLAGEDLITVVPTVDLDRPTVNVDDSAVLGLDQHAAAALLRTAERDGPRSHALVALLLLRALRLAEALALDVPDVTDTLRGHRVATITGKGERTRLAALPPAVTRAVDALVAARTTGPVFATRTGTRWQPSGAYRVVRRLARDAGLPPTETNANSIRPARVVAEDGPKQGAPYPVSVPSSATLTGMSVSGYVTQTVRAEVFRPARREPPPAAHPLAGHDDFVAGAYRSRSLPFICG